MLEIHHLFLLSLKKRKKKSLRIILPKKVYGIIDRQMKFLLANKKKVWIKPIDFHERPLAFTDDWGYPNTTSTPGDSLVWYDYHQFCRYFSACLAFNPLYGTMSKLSPNSWALHYKYIDRKYYDILSCLIYHSNLVVICTADGRIQPIIVTSTTIPWFQPLVVVYQSRFIVDIGIKEK